MLWGSFGEAFVRLVGVIWRPYVVPLGASGHQFESNWGHFGSFGEFFERRDWLPFFEKSENRIMLIKPMVLMILLAVWLHFRIVFDTFSTLISVSIF